MKRWTRNTDFLKFGLQKVLGVNFRSFRSGASARLLPFNVEVRRRKIKDEEKPENLAPLDQYVFQISSDIRKKGRLNKKDIESAVALLESKISVGDHGTFLLSCMGSILPDVNPEGKVMMAQKVWDAIDREGKITYESLDALLKCYAQNEGKIAGDASTLLKKVQAALSTSELDGRELKPSQKTFYYVLLSYCLSGDLDSAVNVLNMVKDEGIPVDEDYFNALIIGNARAGDVKSAQGVLDVLKGVNIEPSAKTYATLMQAYLENNKMEDMEKIYNLAIQKETEFPVLRMLKLLIIAALKKNKYGFNKILHWTLPTDKFNADVVNTIVSLVHSRCPMEGLDILLHFAGPLEVPHEPFGSFFVKEMVIAEIDLPTISMACDTLVNGNHNQYAWNVAAEYTLKYNKFDTTVKLFELMQEQSIPIRPHYFWPMIIQPYDAKLMIDGILEVIKKMDSFGVIPDWETLNEFIVPKMFAEIQNPLQVAKILKENANLSYSSGVLKAILLYLLKQQRLSDAAYLVSKIKGTLNQPQVLVDCLVSSLLKFEERDNIEANLELALPVLKSIYENAPNDVKTDFVGNFVIRFVDAVGLGLVDMVNKFIKGLQTSGIHLSQDTATFLESQKHLTISQLNTNPDLVLVQDSHKVLMKPKEMNIRDLASHAEELKAKNMNERGTLRHLFLRYCQTNDMTKILELKKRFEQNYGPMTPGMYSSLLGAYIRQKRLQPAWDLFQEMKSTNDTLEIDSYKIIDLATLLAENHKTQEALAHLLEECSDLNFNNSDPKVNIRNAVALLDAFHRNDCKENIKQVLDFLLEKQFVEPAAPILGIMIKHLILKDDLTAAVNLFVEYSQKYGVIACRQQLTSAVLDRDDLLKKVVSTCTQRYGESNAKHALAFAMSDKDRIPGATNILSELMRKNRLNFAAIVKQAEYHSKRNDIKKLINLIEAISKATSSFDCSSLYLIALQSCEISRCGDDMKLVLSSLEACESFLSSSVIKYADSLRKGYSTKQQLPHWQF